MLAVILKNSIVYRITSRILHGTASAYKCSTFRNAALSYRYSALRKIFIFINTAWKNSVVYRLLMCFVNPDIDWKESFFYRLVSMLVIKPISVLSDVFGDKLAAGIKNSKCICAWDKYNKAIKDYVFYYIALAVFVMSNIYILLSLYKKSEAFVIIASVLIWLISLLLAVLLKNCSTEGILNNSSAYNFFKSLLKEFWSAED